MRIYLNGTVFVPSLKPGDNFHFISNLMLGVVVVVCVWRGVGDTDSGDCLFIKYEEQYGDEFRPERSWED